MEVGKMPYNWPADTDFALWELDVLDRDCPACGRRMYICDHRYRRFHTLEGPVQLICKLNQAILERQRKATAGSPEAVAESPEATEPEATVSVLAAEDSGPAEEQDSACDVVLDYCTAVRGIRFATTWRR